MRTTVARALLLVVLLLVGAESACSRRRRRCAPTGPGCTGCSAAATNGQCASHDSTNHCPITCRPGFKGLDYTWAEKGLDYVCGCGGQWSSSPANTALNCQIIGGWCNGTSLGAMSQLEISDPSCLRRVADTCTASCKAGYKPTGVGSNQYTCGEDTSWTAAGGTELECVRVCPDDPEPFASFRHGCTHDIGVKCSAQCDPGYSSNASTGVSVSYTCGDTGKWTSDEKLGCVLVGCADAEPAGPSAEPCESADPGNRCETKCKVGYTAKGGSPYFNCTRDGEWKEDPDEGTLVCEAILGFCAGNPEDESGYGQNIVLAEGCHRTVGSVCEAVCTEGTAPIPGTNQGYKCAPYGTRTDHGQWVPTTGRPLECGRLCSHDAPAQNAEFNAGCTDETKRALASCVATCKDGYSQAGGIGGYNCDPATGEWASFEPGQELRCARGNPNSAIGAATDSFMQQGTTAQVAEIFALVAAAVAAAICCYQRRKRRGAQQTAGVLRESFLEPDQLPATKLTTLVRICQQLSLFR